MQSRWRMVIRGWSLAPTVRIALALLVLPLPIARADELDELLRKFRERTGTPGLSVAIVKENRILDARASGFADLEHRVMATPDTVYELGSITRDMTQFRYLTCEKIARPVNRYGFVADSICGDRITAPAAVSYWTAYFTPEGRSPMSRSSSEVHSQPSPERWSTVTVG